MSKKVGPKNYVARVNCINPVSKKYCYAGEPAVFTLGKSLTAKDIKHFREVAADEVLQDGPTEAESLLEVQIQGMSVGKLAQWLMVYYQVKIDIGQARETAYQQAIDIIRNPEIKPRTDAEILAALNTINKEQSPADIPSGKPNPVVPLKGKEGESDVTTETDENTDAKSHKLFKDMNADDIDALDVKDIIPLVKEMYGVEMANAGNKTVRLNKALEIEAAALQAKEGVILDRDK